MNEKIVPSWYSDAKYKQASSIWFLKVSLFACFFFCYSFFCLYLESSGLTLSPNANPHHQKILLKILVLLPPKAHDS